MQFENKTVEGVVTVVTVDALDKVRMELNLTPIVEKLRTHVVQQLYDSMPYDQRGKYDRPRRKDLSDQEIVKLYSFLGYLQSRLGITDSADDDMFVLNKAIENELTDEIKPRKIEPENIA